MTNGSGYEHSTKKAVVYEVESILRVIPPAGMLVAKKSQESALMKTICLAPLGMQPGAVVALF